LGRTGLAVSAIRFRGWGIGGNRFGNSYGPTDDAESLRAYRRAYELGCNFFDTADVYGTVTRRSSWAGRSRDPPACARGDQGRRQFLQPGREPAVVGRIAEAAGRPVAELAPDIPLPVTHDANFSPDYIRFAVEQSLRRLPPTTSTCCSSTIPPRLIADRILPGAEDLSETEDPVYGVSVHPPEEGLAAVEVTRPNTSNRVQHRAARGGRPLPCLAHAANIV